MAGGFVCSNRSNTLPFENRSDIARIALSPTASLLLSVDDVGRAVLVNFRRRVVLHHFNFKDKVYDVQFSPNGRYFAVTHGKLVQVWRTPALTVEFAPFVLHRTYAGHYDDTTAIQWSHDSRFFLSCSKDNTVRMFSLDPEPDFVPVVFAGHREKVVGAFFSSDRKSVRLLRVGVGVWGVSIANTCVCRSTRSAAMAHCLCGNQGPANSNTPIAPSPSRGRLRRATTLSKPRYCVAHTTCSFFFFDCGPSCFAEQG